MTIDAKLPLENKNERISAWVRNKTAAGGERMEVALDWAANTVDRKKSAKMCARIPSCIPGILE